MANRWNTDSPYNVHLVNAVVEDVIENDQRFVEGSMTLNGISVTPTWTGDYSDNTRQFSVPLEDGSNEHTIIYQTEIFNFQSNNVNNPSLYRNTARLINFKNDIGEVTTSASADAEYFSDISNQNPTKTGEQTDDDLIVWEATINNNALPVKNGQIRDILDANQVYVGFPEVYAVINGADYLIPQSAYIYEETTVNGMPAFVITFEGPTMFTPEETRNGIHYTYKLKYTTSLREDFIGSGSVSNTIQLIGFESDTVIESIPTTTYAEKWYFGVGGSSQSITLELNKQNFDTREGIPGVSFSLDVVKGQNNARTEVASFVTTQSGIEVLTNLRSGRYILTEESTTADYIPIDPVHFILGYGENGEVTITITDSNWNEVDNQAIFIDELTFVVFNQQHNTDVSATKSWVNTPNESIPTVWFKLYRQIEGGTVEEVPDAEIKELSAGIEEVLWENIADRDTEGNLYSFSVREVNENGFDYVPEGYEKVEDGLHVTNTNIETVNVSGEKGWKDYNNRFDTRPDSITVNLLADGVEVDEAIVTPHPVTDRWEYAFTNLPKYSNGEEIVYTVTEDIVPGYDPAQYFETDILNTFRNLETVDINGQKVWKDYDNSFSTRPVSVTVELLQNGEVIAIQEVSAGDNGEWRYAFISQPRYNGNGDPYVYTVNEQAVPNYTTVINGTTITNTYVNTETVQVNGQNFGMIMTINLAHVQKTSLFT